MRIISTGISMIFKKLSSVFALSYTLTGSPAFSQNRMTANIPKSAFSVCDEYPISQLQLDTGLEFPLPLTVEQAQRELTAQEELLHSLSAPKYPRAFFIFEEDPEYQYVFNYVQKLMQTQRRWWGYDCNKNIDEREAVDDLIVPRVCTHLETKASILEEIDKSGRVKLMSTRPTLQSLRTTPPDPFYDRNQITLYPDASLAAFFYREVCHTARFYKADTLDSAIYNNSYLGNIPFVPSFLTSLSVQVTWDRLHEDEKGKMGFPPDLPGVFRDVLRTATKKGVEAEVQGKHYKNAKEFAGAVLKKMFINEYLEWTLSDGRIAQRMEGCPLSSDEKNLPEKIEEQEQKKSRILQSIDKRMSEFREQAFVIPAVFRTCLCDEPANKEIQQLEERIKLLQSSAETLKYGYGVVKISCATTKEHAGAFFLRDYGYVPQEYSSKKDVFGSPTWCAQTRGFWKRDGFPVPENLPEWLESHSFAGNKSGLSTLNYFSSSCAARQCWGDARYTSRYDLVLKKIADIEKQIRKNRKGLFYTKDSCGFFPIALPNLEIANASMALLYAVSCQPQKAHSLLQGLEKQYPLGSEEAEALKGLTYYALADILRAAAVQEHFSTKNPSPHIFPWLSALSHLLGEEEQSIYYALLSERHLNHIPSWPDRPRTHQQLRIEVASLMIENDKVLRWNPRISISAIDFPSLTSERGILVQPSYFSSYPQLDLQALLLVSDLLLAKDMFP